MAVFGEKVLVALGGCLGELLGGSAKKFWHLCQKIDKFLAA